MQPSTTAKNSRSVGSIFFPFKFIINFSSALLLTLFLLPGLSLIIRAITIKSTNHDSVFYEIITPLTLSLFTTAISVFIIFILGTPLAYNLARKKNILKRIISIFIELPIQPLLFNRHSDRVPPFSPATIIIANVRIPQ